MSFLRLLSTALVLAAIAGNASPAFSDRASVRKTDTSGTVDVPPFSLPLSQYMSEQSKARYVQQLEQRHRPTVSEDDPNYVQIKRKDVDDLIRPKVERARRRYPVDIESLTIAGIGAHVITPKLGVSPENRNRILINLHGGGFTVGAGLHGIAESTPVAAIGGFKVITLDYRMAPEYRFPAASEDVTAVYKALLKQFDATEIGIYGCSAGGILTAMAISWFQKENLPMPGAVGILSSAAFGNFFSRRGSGSWGGDSAYIAKLLAGGRPMPPDEDYDLPRDSYFHGIDVSDPLVSPALSPAVLAKFPPTLLLTGTRAWDMSAAVQTQRELVKAGVDAQLHLWDGMGHCFFLEEDLPESEEAYAVVVKFFKTNLSTRR